MQKGAGKMAAVKFNREKNMFRCSATGIETSQIYTLKGVPGGYLTPHVLLWAVQRAIDHGTFKGDIDSVRRALLEKYKLVTLPTLPRDAHVAALFESDADFRTWLSVPGATTAAEWAAAHPPRARKESGIKKTAGKPKKEKKAKPHKLAAGAYIIKPTKNVDKAIKAIDNTVTLIKKEFQFGGLETRTEKGIRYVYATDAKAGAPNPYVEGAFGPVLVRAKHQFSVNAQ